ncbi:MAG: molecular chaperone DnaJ [Desulfobulbus propionicus]|nr:MAG: molecular chaperone DnaJ [Desulfobulbus propionicus]
MLSAIHFIAERRIEQAMAEGTLADLSSWKNKPLPKDDMQHVPADLRMGYKILKNAGYVPEEVGIRKEIKRTEDLLAACTDEKRKYKQLKKLEYLKFKLEVRMGKTLQLDDRSEYNDKVVDAMSVNSTKRESA